MAQYNQDLLVNILGDASSLTKAVHQSKAQLNVLSKSMTRFGKQMSLRLTLPMVAAGGAAIKMAADMQESLNKVDVAFGNSSKEVKDFAKTTLKQFGIARGSALEMTSLFGDMATGMGVSRKEAAKMSIRLTGLAGDLASFKNINIDEAMTALGGVFTGETESLKRLGIVMTEANLEQFRMAEGIGKSVKKMTQQEKIMLRLRYIFSVTKNAQGDFARTSDSASNQARIFSEGVKELSSTFGEILLPVFTKIVTKINHVIQRFQALDGEQKQMIVTIGLIIAAIPLLITALGTILNPINAIVIGLAAIAITIYTQWSKIAPEIVKVTNHLIDLYNNSIMVQKAVALIRIGYAVAFSSISYLIKNSIDLLTAFIGTIFNTVKLLVRLAQLIVPDFSGRSFSDEIDAVGDAWSDLSASMGDGFSSLFGFFESNEYQSHVDSAKDALGDIGKPLEKITTESLNEGIKSGVENLEQSIKSSLQNVMNKVGLGASTTGEPSGEGSTSGTTGSGSSEGFTPYQDDAVDAVLQLPIVDFDEQRAQEEIDQFIAATNDMLAAQESAKEKMEGLNMRLNYMFNSFIADTVSKVAEAFGEMMAGSSNAMYNLSRTILSGMGQLLKSFGKQLIAYGIAVEAFKNAFADPKKAILAGIAMTVIGSMITSSLKKNSEITAFANGGIVSAPTLGLMGEYAGARSNPEVIAPLDKLKNMMPQSGNNVNVNGEFVVRGQDLIVVLERANRNRNKFI